MDTTEKEDSKVERLSRKNPVGGFAFFSSLFLLCFLALFNGLALIEMQNSTTAFRWMWFAAGSFIGFESSRRFFPERFCVFIHELKHSIISNLAGNRAKKFKVADRTGSFTYEYTKKTAAYNAFIALAPYWFPLFSLVGIPLAGIALSTQPAIMLAVAGVLYGADSALNVRDVSPIQTDISGIRGGFQIGLVYIIAMNAVIFSILGAWVSKDLLGLLALVQSLWNFLHEIVLHFIPSARTE